jgi:hypothetical protein
LIVTIVHRSAKKGGVHCFVTDVRSGRHGTAVQLVWYDRSYKKIRRLLLRFVQPEPAAGGRNQDHDCIQAVARAGTTALQCSADPVGSPIAARILNRLRDCDSRSGNWTVVRDCRLVAHNRSTMQFYKSAIVGFCLWAVASAQALPAQPPAGTDLDLLLRGSRWQELRDQQAAQQAALAPRQNEQQAEREFLGSMHQFVLLWNLFANEYNDRGTFNLKLAKEVSKAFRKLENTTAWPNAGRKR